jgi:hypothetical protein
VSVSVSVSVRVSFSLWPRMKLIGSLLNSYPHLPMKSQGGNITADAFCEWWSNQ